MPRQLQASEFVHLHNHTQYSLLDGLTKIPEMVDYVSDHGMTAIAMTDHGTLSGAVEFYKASKAKGIKPIIGMETYVAPRKFSDKDPAKDKTPYHLILLAMNKTGYENLMRLSTIANLEGFYYKPRVDHDLLNKYNEGIIVLSGCIGGEVGDSLRNDQYEKARDIATWYKSVFGDRYYLEVQDHGHPEHSSAWGEQVAVTEKTFKLSNELNIPCVVTCDAHYLRHKDQEAHEILLCVQTGAFLSDEKRMSLKEFELHVTNPNDIIARWSKEHPEVITNTKAIAERCDLELSLGNILIPSFEVPSKETEESYLHKLVYRGLAWRYGGVVEEQTTGLSVATAKKTLSKDILERAEFELSVISKMGFNGYFLIIADFINWGKDQGIVFGPGRGSAAGSIIAYALKITELDPMRYDLLFERFLNPDRISMPDIDIDIQDTRRDEVIQYCVEKYGTNRVANIVTFGRMAARNAVRDVARVLQVPYAEADRLAKMIPPPVQGRHIPLKTSLKENAELKAEYKQNETAQRVFDLAVQLEGTIRSHGVHAAGVVIAPDEIVKYAPLEMAQKGVVATQYSMGPVEELGLLKMDFLGLSNLTIIKNTLRIIKRVYGKDLDIDRIGLDDAKTYALLQKGDTTGVFQLESAGMKRYLKDLKPTVFEDIVAMVALYRPGPMQFIDSFIRRKHGEESISYLHPKMENALKSTYGVLVYQEQFMQISKDLAGFTGGQADTLRKAVGKKILSMMQKIKPEFIEGAIQHSKADTKLMEKFWDQLEEFANYCFNKSHAACYALIAYQTAYLKAHYPAAFMAALMTSDFDDTDRLAIEITECNHMGITVLPPDVNESFVEFGVVPQQNQIRFGMAAVKNVGSSAVEEILRARSEGRFTSLEDFFERVNVRLVNRKTVESLIKSGSFDQFEKRDILLANIDVLLAYGARIQKQKALGQTDIFGEDLGSGLSVKAKITLNTSVTPIPQHEQLQWERELLGLYLSQHPLEDYRVWLSEQTIPLNSLDSSMQDKIAIVGGVIAASREIITKKGQKMAFVRLADESHELELVLFPSVYESSLDLWQKDRVVAVTGKIDALDRDGNPGELKIIVNSAREITHSEAKSYAPSGKTMKLLKTSSKSKKTTDKPSNMKSAGDKLYVRMEDSNNLVQLEKLKKLIDQHQGKNEVILVLGTPESRQAMRLPSRVTISAEFTSLLEELLGADHVQVA